jgi:nucleoside-diphosphate-sugar epimerase
VSSIGLTAKDDIQLDIAASIPEINFQFDIVLHAAGKAHSIPKTASEKQMFFDVNYKGTVNLCKGLEESGLPKSFIFISTVAVYGLEEGEDIKEDTPLAGNTPYALSKILAEKYLQDWCSKHNVILGIIRPSLIAGPNPPGNLGAMINGIQTGKYLSIGAGKARKSVLMVDDIAKLVPLLAEKGGIYNVCSSYHPSFSELESLICSQLRMRKPINIPTQMAFLIARVGDILGERFPINSLKLNKIIRPLTFCNEKAKNELGWEPLDVLDNFKIR